MSTWSSCGSLTFKVYYVNPMAGTPMRTWVPHGTLKVWTSVCNIYKTVKGLSRKIPCLGECNTGNIGNTSGDNSRLNCNIYRVRGENCIGSSKEQKSWLASCNIYGVRGTSCIHTARGTRFNVIHTRNQNFVKCDNSHWLPSTWLVGNAKSPWQEWWRQLYIF